MSKLITNEIENVTGTASVKVEHLQLKSPDGSKWRITIADNGTMTAVKIT